MIKSLHKVLGYLLAGVILVSGAATASAADVVEVTHTPDCFLYPYTGYKAFERTDAVVVQRFPASMLKNYVGATVVSVKVGWGTQAENGKVRAFIRESLEGEDLRQSSDVTVTAKWATGAQALTAARLKGDAYTIEAGKDLYVGYYTTMPAEEYSIPTYTNRNGVPANTQWLGRLLPDGEKYVSTSYEYGDEEGNDANLVLMSVVLRVESGALVDIGELTHIFTPACMIYKRAANGLFTISNPGTNDISSLTLEYAGPNGTKASYTYERTIAAGKSNRVYSPVIPVEPGVHTVTLTKVNGKDNKLAQPIELDILGVDADVASQFTRRPVAECFVSESNYTIPNTIDDFYEPGIMDFKDQFTMIYRHMGDQFMIDEGLYEYDEDTELARYYCAGDKYSIWSPSMMLDRAWNYGMRNELTSGGRFITAIPTPMFAESQYVEALKIPTFANVELSSDFEEPGKPFTITAKGRIAPGTLGDRKLNLTLYLAENNVESTSQMFRNDQESADYGGVYTHQHVIRLQFTPMFGDELKPDANGNFEMTYEAEIDPEDEWKPEDMELIAILNRPQLKDHLRCHIVNSCQVSLKGSVGSVDQVSADRLPQPVVTDGTVTVPGAQNVKVYTPGGVEVGTSGLRPGLYLVSYKVAGTTGAAKIVVK